MRIIMGYIRHEHGQTMLDYALILVFVSVAGLVALDTIGNHVVAYLASVVLP